MTSFLISRINIAFRRIEQVIANYFGNGFPPGAVGAIDSAYFDQNRAPSYNPMSFDLESLKNGFLFAVPTKRRSVEKRRKRKFGWPKYVWKPYVPKSDIIMCTNCGHYHEATTLCNYCYNVVRTETTQLQEQIVKELGLQPIEKEVVVLYDGESSDELNEYWKNQKIVEVRRKRPDWFNSNLLQSTTEKEGKHKDEENVIKGKINDL